VDPLLDSSENMASLWSLFSSHEIDEDKNVLHRQVTPSLSPPPPAKRARLSGEEIQLGGLVNNPLLLAPVNTFHHPPISIDRDVDKIVKGIRLENRKRSNAVHAKRSRERNKQFVASLELESQALQKENDCLKALVKKNLPDRAQSIIGECCYKPRGKGFPQGTQATSRLAHIIGSDFDLLESLTSGGHSFVLTDPRLPDNPIVYASSAFFKMTGYTRDTVVGRNCRFLQGIDTKTEAVNTIREAIKSGTDGAACLLNYKADGTPFWNSFFIAALRDRDHRIVNYVSNILIF
jgi:PAS domain S-box-containing protein